MSANTSRPSSKPAAGPVVARRFAPAFRAVGVDIVDYVIIQPIQYPIHVHVGEFPNNIRANNKNKIVSKTKMK